MNKVQPKPFWKRFRLRAIAILLSVIMLFFGIQFTMWTNESAMNLLPEVAPALEDTATVDVTQDAWITFAPTDNAPTVGLILYPGGPIITDAYAPLAKQIAEAGYFVALIYPPFNLAILDTAAAAPVIEANPQIEQWVIGGHSLGGASAAIYLSGDAPASITGLVLMGSFAPGDTLTTRDDLAVLSIFGTEDGLATVEEIEESASALPADTQYVAIEGGNHAQFGYYGDQDGDLPATISREEQINQTVEAIVEFLASLQ